MRPLVSFDHKLGLINGIDHIEVEHAGEMLSQQAASWLDQRGPVSTPLFLWAHFIEPHNWANTHKPKDGARTKSDRYIKSLEATDQSLDVLLSAIRHQLGDDTIIVVTADHGEGLGDHGSPRHAATLYNSEIRIPLVIAGPGIAPTRIKQVIGLVDLPPTLLDLAGFEPPGMPHMDGLSVAPELRGERQDFLGAGEAYSVIVKDRSVPQTQAAIMSGRFKLISKTGASLELYDMTADPGETRDIKELAPDVLESMKARLERRRQLDRVPPF